MAPSDVAGPRVGAALLDLALYVAACAALFFAMAESTQGFVYLDSPQFHLDAGDTLYYVDGPAAQLYWLATLVLAFVQFGVLPGLTGWTPGKLVTGLRVRRPDGARRLRPEPGARRALDRRWLPLLHPRPGGLRDGARPERPAPAAAAPAWFPEDGPEAPR
jgi:hypothetical protein